MDLATKDPCLLQIKWIHGMRGLASFLVFSGHFEEAYHRQLGQGWQTHEPLNVFQLPFIRYVVKSENAQVTIFFVISGYVLAYRPIYLIRRHKYDQAFHNIVSAIFRRGLRLTSLPIFAFLVVFILVRSHLTEYIESYTIAGDIPGWVWEFPERKDTVALQLWDMITSFVRLIDPFDGGVHINSYEKVLWTIPVEFRDSMILFAILIGMTRPPLPTYRVLLCSPMITGINLILAGQVVINSA